MNGAPPPLDGVRPSRLRLPKGPWQTILDGLAAQFPQVSAVTWAERFARLRILDAAANPLSANAPYRAGTLIYYYRELAFETPVEAREQVLSLDQHLLVADKPHGLAVAPTGKHVTETLLTRLLRQFDLPDLVPLHRIDRETAGLVMFSTDRASRVAYHQLFRDRRIDKRYLALAPALPGRAWPLTRCSAIVRGEPFFRMRETDAQHNAETRIKAHANQDPIWTYHLQPKTGRKHQLRLHMSALGAPIIGDRLYPQLLEENAPSSGPLQLLAHSLSFVDPINGNHRHFQTSLALQPTKTAQENSEAG